MDTAGPLATELYIVADIKEIYSSQGQTVNAKHIELIVRQMFSKVRITNAGDSTFFPGDIVDIIRFMKENRELRSTSQMKRQSDTNAPWSHKNLTLYWVLALRSILSGNSSSTRRCFHFSKIDNLEGLKENVIIGRLIPTLKYFENNRDVGEFFSHESDGNAPSDYLDDHFEITTASTSLV
jgi:DNA-directed RNA polymerase subunit beta'